MKSFQTLKRVVIDHFTLNEIAIGYVMGVRVGAMQKALELNKHRFCLLSGYH